MNVEIKLQNRIYYHKFQTLHIKILIKNFYFVF